MRPVKETSRLIEGARALGIALTEADAARLLLLLDELATRGAGGFGDEPAEPAAADPTVIAGREQAAGRREDAEHGEDELAVVLLGDEAALLGGRVARRVDDHEIESFSFLPNCQGARQSLMCSE